MQFLIEEQTILKSFQILLAKFFSHIDMCACSFSVFFFFFKHARYKFYHSFLENTHQQILCCPSQEDSAFQSESRASDSMAPWGTGGPRHPRQKELRAWLLLVCPLSGLHGRPTYFFKNKVSRSRERQKKPDYEQAMSVCFYHKTQV